jgi:hypothetical protein
MLKCQDINLNLLYKIESHSSSGVVSFLNSLNITWFAMRKKEEEEEEEKRKRVNPFIASFSVTKMILILLFVY